MSPKVQRGLNLLQKISMSLMGVLVLITFVGANLHAILWQSSEWLVSTVLPAVVISLTNEERSEISKPPLVRNASLDKAAQLKAEHMAKNQYFSHHSPDGISPWHWFDEAGYVYAHAGENLAIHFTDSSEVVDAWMKSPTHRENIVNGLYQEIGVGTAKGEYEGYDTVYVVQLFGTPAVPPEPKPDPAPIAIAEPEPVVPETIFATEVEIETEVTEPEAVVESDNDAADNTESDILVQEPTPILTALPEVESETETNIPDEVLSQNPEIDTTVDFREVVIVESSLISTSSGLAVAQISTSPEPHAGATIASFATQPNTILQMAYMVLAVIVVMLLGTSVVIETRRLHFEQVAYGLLLLFGMGGLWFINSLLTTGAVVV